MGRYDEWAAARTPALLRLAHALTGDERTAVEAVRRALDRMRASWVRVSRGDPDLEVRRVLVRRCAGHDRAAAVLRSLESRSDAEIAEVLGCSESAARRHVARGLPVASSLGRQSPSGQPHDAPAPDTAGVGLLAPAGVSPGPPSRRHHRAIAAAVVAVLLLVGGIAFVAHQSRAPAGEISYPSTDTPPTWRYESYAGVQVQVPPAWGWGGAPMHSDIFHGRDSLGSCGASTAAVQSPQDPASYITLNTGFTGRPVMVSDRCIPWGADGTVPLGNALWFASPLEVGVRTIGGVMAETRAVGSQHITVFSRSSALRREILGTATTVDTDANGCPTQAVIRPAAGPPGLHADSLSVCVYTQDTGTTVLLWSGRLSEHTTQEYVDAMRAAPPAPAVCPATPSGTWVALGVHGSDGTRWDLVDLSCSRISSAGGLQAALTPATAIAWAGGAVAAYVPEPTHARGLQGFFRPKLG